MLARSTVDWLQSKIFLVYFMTFRVVLRNQYFLVSNRNFRDTEQPEAQNFLYARQVITL